jgi:hypothetical protein
MKMDGWAFSIAAVAAVFVGISKAGFGGGTGILATPLMVAVFPPRLAIGVLLPLLIMCDWVSCALYWRQWNSRALAPFLPACGVGILVGSFFLDTLSDRWLRIVLGVICIGFCALQWLGRRANLEPKKANWSRGTLAGSTAGFVSTLAHAAGPVFAMYALPMGMSPRVYVATSVLAFTVVNLLKVPGYLAAGVLSGSVVAPAICLAPFLFAGTALGFWMNGKLNAQNFARVIYAILFLTGIELLTGFGPFFWLQRAC